MRLRKAFSNGSSANIKLSKTQLYEIQYLGGFLGRLLGPLIKTGLPLIKNVLKPVAKSVLIPLGLTAAALATEAAVHKKLFGSAHPLDSASHTKTLKILNEESKMKMIKCIEESALLIKGVSETIQNEAKEQKGRFISTLLGTLGASLLGNLLTGKGAIRVGEDTIRAGKIFYNRVIL